jgi:hypothetical protein
MGLWGNQGGDSNLTPTGVGGGPSQAQMELFNQAAQDSGLATMGMNMVDQATSGGMRNEDQMSAFYHLLASHPNEVSLFFLHYPHFLSELAALIALIVKKELFGFFNAGIVNTGAERGAPLSVDAAAGIEYASITDENIEAQVAKVAPLQQMQMEVNQKDMAAMQMVNQGQMNQQQQQQAQQQQMYQQQMYQQQQMQQQQPQSQGFGSAIGNFGSSLIRGTLGLPAAQQQQQVGMPPQMGMQQGHQGGY